MATVRVLREWLERLPAEAAVYALQGLDDGIVVVTDDHTQFLHAAQVDLDVQDALRRQTALERQREAWRADEHRYWGD